MLQINFNVFFIYILPLIVGLIIALCLWKFKITRVLVCIMLFAAIVWWCILHSINTHGSEGPGILATMYSQCTLAFTAIEIIKFTLKGKNKK